MGRTAMTTMRMRRRVPLDEELRLSVKSCRRLTPALSPSTTRTIAALLAKVVLLSTKEKKIRITKNTKKETEKEFSCKNVRNVTVVLRQHDTTIITPPWTRIRFSQIRSRGDLRCVAWVLGGRQGKKECPRMSDLYNEKGCRWAVDGTRNDYKAKSSSSCRLWHM